MPRHFARFGIALGCVAVLSVGGCTGTPRVFEDQNEGGWFAKSVDLFGKPDWARASGGRNINLGPQGPAGAEDLVSADGRCAAPAQSAELSPAATEPPAPADRAVGSVAGDLAGGPLPTATTASAT
ncbi:MAG: hypothetical protein WCD56_17965, partial [Pseudolabrys sp.]